MALKIAVQMDPIESIKVHGDSTFVLMLAAQARGHSLYTYQPHDMYSEGQELRARVTAVTVHDNINHHVTKQDTEIVDLSNMDVVLMRQDPPFDMNYLTYTYLLENIHPRTLVINPPNTVRDCPEKLFVTHFAQHMPDTRICYTLDHCEAFFDLHQDVILKPLYAHGGNDILHATNKDSLVSAYSHITEKHPMPLMIQAFIEKVSEGDKRIIFINGEVAGAINRVPEKGNILSNLVQGGSAEATQLSEKDIAICDTLSPILKQKELMLVGIDVIDGFLTEINVTSPTGLWHINQLYDKNTGAMFWDAVEQKLSNK